MAQKIYPKCLYTLAGVLCAVAAALFVLLALADSHLWLIAAAFFICGVMANFGNRHRFYGPQASAHTPQPPPYTIAAEVPDEVPDAEPAANDPDPGPVPTLMADVIALSGQMYSCLAAMSAHRSVLEALDGESQLDSVRRIHVGDGSIDSRLAFLAAADLIKCFEGLGATPDMTTDRGRAIGLVLARIIAPDTGILRDEASLQLPQTREILHNSYHAFKDNIEMQFAPDRFLLIELLRRHGVDESTVSRWAALQYDFTRLAADFPPSLSAAHARWLDTVGQAVTAGEPPAAEPPVPPAPPESDDKGKAD